MTRCVVHSPLPAYRDGWVGALSIEGIEHQVAEKLPDFGSLLFRDPEATGLIWCIDWIDAADIAAECRRAEIKNPILAIIEQDSMNDAKKARDRASVLKAGADDVQPTPIADDELIARLKAISSRGAYFDHQCVKLPNDCVFLHDQRVIRGPLGDTRVSPKECDLLSAFVRHPNFTLTRAQIMDALYADVEAEPDIKIVDVWVCKLRAKIMRATGGIDCIQNQWGRGYYFDPTGFVPDLITFRAVRARQAAL